LQTINQYIAYAAQAFLNNLCDMTLLDCHTSTILSESFFSRICNDNVQTTKPGNSHSCEHGIYHEHKHDDGYDYEC